jgi:hypothetical protein
VHLVVGTKIRLARLRAREAARSGHEGITPGGARQDAHLEFLSWAGGYDTGGVEMRSRALHEAWLLTLPGAVLRLEGDRPVAERPARIERAVHLEPVERAYNREQSHTQEVGTER